MGHFGNLTFCEEFRVQAIWVSLSLFFFLLSLSLSLSLPGGLIRKSRWRTVDRKTPSGLAIIERVRLPLDCILLEGCGGTTFTDTAHVVLGFPPTCARAVLTHPDLLNFVPCYLAFQQFRMVVSRCDCQKAEVCECVSYMYCTFSQDIGAIRLAPCCCPNKRCEIFMNMTTSPCNLMKFSFETLFFHHFFV